MDSRALRAGSRAAMGELDRTLVVVESEELLLDVNYIHPRTTITSSRLGAGPDLT